MGAPRDDGAQAGNEELAKEALARKREHDALAATFKDQWTKQKNAVEQLKKALRMLNDKIEEAKRKKNVLIARKKRAEAQKRHPGDDERPARITSAFETFDRMSRKIDQIEAEAEAQSELPSSTRATCSPQQFAQAREDAGADDDLVALKRKMGMLPAGRGQGSPPKPSRRASRPRRTAGAARARRPSKTSSPPRSRRWKPSRSAGRRSADRREAVTAAPPSSPGRATPVHAEAIDALLARLGSDPAAAV